MTRAQVFVAVRFGSPDTPHPHIYALSLHDALPISWASGDGASSRHVATSTAPLCRSARNCWRSPRRSEEHTSELQSHSDIVCRLLLEKKKGAGLRALTAEDGAPSGDTGLRT